MRVAVVGLGGIGSQVALALADRGAQVVGFDRLRPPHEDGSSHGESRIIREAYAEGPQYVPLVRRAWQQWEALGRRTGETLLHPTGGIHIGDPAGAYLSSVLAVAREFAIELDELDAEAAAAFAPPPGAVALRERNAGWIAIERAVDGTLRLAQTAGAQLRLGMPVTRLERDGPDPVLVTRAGRERFDRAVVCAGAWMSELVPELAPALELERQTLAWFDPPALAPDAIWFGEYAPGRYVYGFPPDRHGAKAAIHHDGATVTLAELDRTVSDEEARAVASAANALLATPLGDTRRSRTCVYTNTPDRHFAVGALPSDERVVVVSACSGHGFKFAPALGEAAAALALGESPPVDVGPFTLGRPGLLVA